MNAGIDVFMITSQYGNFINLLRSEVQAGRVSMARQSDGTPPLVAKSSLSGAIAVASVPCASRAMGNAGGSVSFL